MDRLTKRIPSQGPFDLALEEIKVFDGDWPVGASGCLWRRGRGKVPSLSMLDVAHRVSGALLRFRTAQVAHAAEAGYAEPAGAVVEVDGVGHAIWHGLLKAEVRQGWGGLGHYGTQHFLLIGPEDDREGLPPRFSRPAVEGEPPPLLAEAATAIQRVLAEASESSPSLALAASPTQIWALAPGSLSCRAVVRQDVFGGRPYLLLSTAPGSAVATKEYM